MAGVSAAITAYWLNQREKTQTNEVRKMGSDLSTQLCNAASSETPCESQLELVDLYLKELQTYEDPMMRSVLMLDKLRLLVMQWITGMKAMVRANHARERGCMIPCDRYRRCKVRCEDDGQVSTCGDADDAVTKKTEEQRQVDALKRTDDNAREERRKLDRLDATYVRLMEELKQMSLWVQQPMYGPQHPYGKAMQVAHATHFEDLCKTHAAASSSSSSSCFVPPPPPPTTASPNVPSVPLAARAALALVNSNTTLP